MDDRTNYFKNNQSYEESEESNIRSVGNILRSGQHLTGSSASASTRNLYICQNC